jgi:pantetheine-phosphate adenylyltransferase
VSQRIAIYAGTFDPITLGHRDIVCRALKLADKLIIAVAQDTGKHPIFTLEQRAELVKAEISQLPASDAERVEVKPFSGLLVNFAREHKARMLVRGLRAVSDFEYEFQMALVNSRLDDELETVFLTASENTHFISSRFVKQVARLEGDISSFVSPHVAEKLKNYFASQPHSSSVA